MIDLTEQEINDAYKRATEPKALHKLIWSKCDFNSGALHITVEDVIKANESLIRKYKSKTIFGKIMKTLAFKK